VNLLRASSSKMTRLYIVKKRRKKTALPIYPWRRSETLPWNKLFQIGYSKVGTSSIFEYLDNNGLASPHWRIKKDWLRTFYAEGCLGDWPGVEEEFSGKTWKNIEAIEKQHCIKTIEEWHLDESLEARCLGYIDVSEPYAHLVATRMRICEIADKPLLDLVPEFYDVFTDVRATAFGVYKDPNAKDGTGFIREYIEGYKKFGLLDAQYPNSRFILNLRDPQKWVKSELNWDLKRHVPNWHRLAYALDLAPEDLREHLLADWDAHVAAVRAHFADRPGQLMEIDLEKDVPEEIPARINEFLGLDLDVRHWGAKNVNPKKVA